jgi:hypothetical protein
MPPLLERFGGNPACGRSRPERRPLSAEPSAQVKTLR